MKTLHHEPRLNTRNRSCLTATWIVVLYVLSAWSQLSNTVQAGCFVGHDYNDFHHARGLENHQRQIHRQPRLFSYSADVWIFEDGNFQPLRNPLAPRCDGPGCRSNPLEGQWGQSSTAVETLRVVYVISSVPFVTSRTQMQGVRSIERNELPNCGDTISIDRPPKVS